MTENCPICYGRGRLPIYDGSTQPIVLRFATKQPCHGCGGKGWVEVAETLETSNADAEGVLTQS